MDSVLRAAAIYLVLMILFKIGGRRSMAELTTFDLVLLMVIGEATQQALLGDDFSLINATLVIVTLIAIDIGCSLVKQRSKWFSRLLDGGPTVLVEHGQVLYKRLKQARVDEDDILEAARSGQGIIEIKQIKFGILERNGKISIIPYESADDSIRDTREKLPEKSVGEGLTDDQRVSREGEGEQAPNDKGARVRPGPEDENRLKP
ncbi:DUF421 domain-containing protein [Pseudomonas mucidolens]|uniref:YetF C-terminal domain-containing protein n=1 Tax=Pseudomonas mucidolens TaxID=46679 RepID=A0A1H2MR17_9PSED|nr:YetF domain-containing protein [Pseudomonas mucidolens]SDU95653.1 Protein of unknown function [Pseudomonas mucidolens]SQH33389.1 membrane protein [Pseudomonas mucidolens]